MRNIWILIFIISSAGIAKEKKPDIVSLPANLEEYYTFVNGRWVWKEDLKPKKPKRKKHPKGIVTSGKTTIRYIPDEVTRPRSAGN